MLNQEDLIKKVKNYNKFLNPETLSKAYTFALNAHKDQKRDSGDPYLSHPIAVANILSDLKLDSATIATGLLHDTIEDTNTTYNMVQKEFGKEVADLVEGVTKISELEGNIIKNSKAENIRKLILATSKDIRVLLVKLADRLHNMRTLEALKSEKRQRIAKETLEVYAPIALRLGINSIRLELEELGFATLYPLRYRILNEQISKARGNRKEIITKIRTALKRRMRQEKIPGQIFGREKHLHGIYKKMRDQNLSFSDVYDVYAFRIIVDNVDTCYRTVGTVHNLYKPVPGKFKDYIAIPKTNGYQSLHTALFGPYGVPIEIQIRTNEMNDVAEVGIAAHWLYKTENISKSINRVNKGKSDTQRRAKEWLRNIVEMNKTAGNPEEFFENVKIDLFPDEVYIFTPKGKIMELPNGSTTVDFAYAIHTDIGNTCVGARINRKLVPLGTQLTNGQTVEIISTGSGRPNPAWLNFVITAKARSQIRHFLKNLQENEAIALGKRLLNRELEPFSLTYQDISKTDMKYLINENKTVNEDKLFKNIGLGNKMAPLIARQFVVLKKIVSIKNKKSLPENIIPLKIKGTEGMVVSFPKCCYPIPGDPIHGFVTSGRGIVIHRQTCKNLVEYQNQQEKWIDVEWGKDNEEDFQVKIHLNVNNQRGVLATVAATIADADANINSVEMKERDDRHTTLRFIIAVKNRGHLAKVIRKIRLIKSVSHIDRN